MSAKKNRKRYSLKELLCGISKHNIKELIKNTEWAREGEPTDREIVEIYKKPNQHMVK